jgi:hypothetical protein
VALPHSRQGNMATLMNQLLFAPARSLYDPVVQSDVSIDPMGLALVYERLADRMLPGMTVRMRRPRFLTTLAVGAFLCQDYGLDAVAADEVTPPYLVFEWWVVESFVRAREILRDQRQIPGFRKVDTARIARRPLDAAAYLKTASVFGFTGIFRRLARRAHVITEHGLLDEAGASLVELWAEEQGLEGFYRGRSGAGALFRSDLQKAVADGMRDGRTGRRPGHFAELIATHLDPSNPGRKERRRLRDLIENRAGEPAELQFITAALLQRSGPLEFVEEASFLRALRARAPERLAEALGAIDTYEEFCRPLIDAFNWIRYLASMNPQIGVSPDEYLNTAPTAELARRLRKAVDRVAENDLLTELWPERADVLMPLRKLQRPCDLWTKVIDHHRVVQQQKLPEPKRAWIEESPRQRVMVRPAYRLEESPPDDLPYVHEYRIPTLSRFLADLHGYA